jgi:hypothetical protein
VRSLSVELGQHLFQAVIRPAAPLAFFQRRAQRRQLGLLFALAQRLGPGPDHLLDGREPPACQLRLGEASDVVGKIGETLTGVQ